MENVNFTIFFGGFVVSLLASIGVLQTPGPVDLAFPGTPGGVPGY